VSTDINHPSRSPEPFKIEEGKRYWTRAGDLSDPVYRDKEGQLRARVADYKRDGLSYRPDGTVLVVEVGTEDSEDLVSEATP